MTLATSLASASLAVACGGRTATEDDSSLDDGLLVASGDVVEVTNQVATGTVGTPTGGPGTTPPSSTGTRPIPPRPQPTASVTPPRPTPTVTPPVPVPSTGVTTVTPPTTAPSTTDSTSPPDTTSGTDEPASTTTVPTTDWSSSEPDPTTTDVTSEPPPPFDPLHPPAGQVPLGLPAEYATAAWFDTDSEACSINYGWAGSSSCNESNWCYDSGETAIDCGRTSTGDYSCGCRDFNGLYSTIVVPGAIVPDNDASQACRIGTAICVSDVPPTDSAECVDTESGSTSYCSRTRQCAETWRSSYGDFTKDTQDTSVGCYANGDAERSSCYCYGSSGYSSFDVSSGPASVCEIGLDVCVAGVEEGSLGPVQCAWVQRNLWTTSCSQSYSCSQEGTFNGAVVSTRSQEYVNCSQLQDGSWSCYCGYYAEQLEPLAATDSEEACNLGGQQCIDRLTRLFE